MHCCRNVSTLNCVSLIVDVCLNCVFLQEGLIELCIVDVCLNCVIQCVSLQEGLNAARTIPKQVTQVSHSVTLRGRRGRRPGTGYMRKIYEKEKGRRPGTGCMRYTRKTYKKGI